VLYINQWDNFGVDDPTALEKLSQTRVSESICVAGGIFLGSGRLCGDYVDRWTLSEYESIFIAGGHHLGISCILCGAAAYLAKWGILQVLVLLTTSALCAS
jgi:hypothetical protein